MIGGNNKLSLIFDIIDLLFDYNFMPIFVFPRHYWDEEKKNEMIGNLKRKTYKKLLYIHKLIISIWKLRAWI